MKEISLLVVGKVDRDFLAKTSQFYENKIKRYTKLNIIELKEHTNKDIKTNINSQTEEIKSKLVANFKDYYKILLSLSGENLTSKQIASIISSQKNLYYKNMVLIIGGSNGLDENQLENIIDQKISFGQITLPHQLCRIILLEQIYRAFKIINNEKYDK